MHTYGIIGIYLLSYFSVISRISDNYSTSEDIKFLCQNGLYSLSSIQQPDYHFIWTGKIEFGRAILAAPLTAYI